MDATVTLRTVVMGTGSTVANIAPPGISGIGVPGPKTTDVDLDGQPGSYGGNEYPAARALTVPLVIVQDTAGDALAELDTLNTAWAAVEDGGDETLDVDIDGWSATYTGRPRGLAVELSDLKNGVIQALGTFVALDPTAT